MERPDYVAHARREAAAILAGAVPSGDVANYQVMIDLVALGWLEGVNYGSHETLEVAERALRSVKEGLT